MHEIAIDEQINLIRDDGEKYPSNLADGEVLKFDDGIGPFFDDLTKQQLLIDLTKLARRKEIEYVESKVVWKRVPISEAFRICGRAPASVGLIRTRATTTAPRYGQD